MDWRKLGTRITDAAIVGRMLADAAAISASLALAHTAGYFYMVLRQEEMDPRVLLEKTLLSFGISFPLLLATTIVVFAALGIYTRARLYNGRHKFLTLFHGISFSFLLALTLIYFLRDVRVSRVVVLLSYLFALATLMGPRLAKALLSRKYRISVTPVRPACGDRRVLVIGGAGYIGSVLVRQLLAAGFRVRVLDSFFFGTESLNAIPRGPNLEVAAGDFRNAETIALAVRNVHDVVHLGGLVGDSACSLDSKVTLQVNLAATKMIRDICLASNVDRFVFASTCSVYGNAREACLERSVGNPVSLYACTKLDSERILLAPAGNTRFRPVILRLATVFGPSHRPRFDLVVNRLTAQGWFQGKITIFNPAQRRPFVHVDDVARTMIAVLEAPAELVGGEIFNVGDDALNHSLEEVGGLIAEVIPGVAVERISQAEDRRSYEVSFAKLRNHLGFRSQYDVAAGIRQFCSLFASGQIIAWQDRRFSNELSLKSLRLRPLEDELPMRWTHQYLAQRDASQPPVAVAAKSA